MKNSKLLFVCLLLWGTVGGAGGAFDGAFGGAINAQTAIVKPDLSVPSKIAPLYFGPSALPIPDMLDGRTNGDFSMELAYDYYDGHMGDMTQGLYFKAILPLFSDRVNLSVWFTSVVEYYQMTEEVREFRSVDESIALEGWEFGDAYISTDIHILKEKRYRPDVALRIVLKSALGGGFHKARYYDTPGYFFDISTGKSFNFTDSYFKELRLSASTGFLCWQTDNGRQNDAVMYGAQIKLQTPHFYISETFGGYWGWEGDGDRPMSLKSEARLQLDALKKFEPLFYHQWGIVDYPFTQWRVGVAYSF